MSSISKSVEEQSTTVRPVCACWYYERSNSIFIGPRWYYEPLVFRKLVIRTPPKYTRVLYKGASISLLREPLCGAYDNNTRMRYQEVTLLFFIEMITIHNGNRPDSR